MHGNAAVANSLANMSLLDIIACLEVECLRHNDILLT